MDRRVSLEMRDLVLTASRLLCAVHWLGAADQRPFAGYVQAPAERPSLDPSKTDQEARYQTDERRRQREAAYEEREFTRRFNGSVYGLRELSETYHAGYVINVKRVKAIQKAWHELEKSDWFKTQKPDGSGGSVRNPV
jgi:hypothetical protein